MKTDTFDPYLRLIYFVNFTIRLRARVCLLETKEEKLNLNNFRLSIFDDAFHLILEILQDVNVFYLLNLFVNRAELINA